MRIALLLALGVLVNEVSAEEWFETESELLAAYCAVMEPPREEEQTLSSEPTYFPELTVAKAQEMLRKASEPYIVESAEHSDTWANEMPVLLIDTAPSGSTDAFYQLPINDRDERLIHELIKTIAEKSIWGLLFKKREMEKLGKKVNHVHPMRFMGHILADSKLRKYLKEVKGSSFKWDHFIDGFSDRMKEEHAKNNLIPHVPGMADLLQVSQEHIMKYIQAKDYEGLVKSLL